MAIFSPTSKKFDIYLDVFAPLSILCTSIYRVIKTKINNLTDVSASIHCKNRKLSPS